jgi:tetratricopeptide (TPR) repeat protein
MNRDRLKQMESYSQEDPADPFPKYVIALEYSRTDYRKGRELFDELLKHHPEYLPAYYQAASLLIKLHDLEQALSVINAGVELARNLGDRKALAELQSLSEQSDES